MRPLAVWPWALVACSPIVEVGTPPIAGYLASITAVKSEGKAILEASAGGRLAPFSGNAEAIAVLGYGQPLEALVLGPGPLEQASNEAGFPLPVPDDIWLAAASRDSVEPWARAETLPDWLASVRLKAGVLSPEECILASGCYVDEAAFLARRCQQPCAIDLPIIPQPEPVTMDCPPGWSTIAEGEHTACAPPERLPSCPDGEAQWIDVATCGPIFDACPAQGEFAQIPGGGSAVYVDAAAAPGGDGSIGSPLSSLSTATGIAVPGQWIALAAGRYPASGRVLRRGVSLIGACPGRSALSTQIETTGLLALDVAGSSTIAGLSVVATGSVAIRILPAGSLFLRGVALEGQGGIGLEAQGELTAMQVTSAGFDHVVERTSLSSPLTLAKMVISGARDNGLELRGGGVIRLEDLVITDGQRVAVRTSDLRPNTRLVVRRSLLARHREVTMHLVGYPTVELSDSVLLDTGRRDAAARLGDGQAFYQAGGRLTVERVRLERHFESGLQMSVVDAQVRDLWAIDITGGGLGGAVNSGQGTANVDGLFGRNLNVGIGVYGAGLVAAEVTLVDVGTGIDVHGVGHALLTRAAITDIRSRGIDQESGRTTASGLRLSGGAFGAYAVEGEMALSEIEVMDQALQPADGGGVGVWISLGASLSLERFSISRARRAGLGLQTMTYEIHDGVLLQNAIGAWVSVLELDRISQRVRYDDNGSTHFEL